MAQQYFVRKRPSMIEPNSTLPIFSALVFATSVAGIGFARAATPDMLFSASITAAMAFAATLLPIAADASTQINGTTVAAQESAVSPLIAQICFGAFLGLGVLAKGPAAVILAGGAMQSGRRSPKTGARHSASQAPPRFSFSARRLAALVRALRRAQS